MENIKLLLQKQKKEITEHCFYKNLAEKSEGKNKKVFSELAKDELKHYNYFKSLTKREVCPSKWSFIKNSILLKLFGFTFTAKLMERNETKAVDKYKKIKMPKEIIADEEKHEKKLLDLIDEERLKYASSTVLGLNDALVEITGVLAGLSFAFQNSRLIALTGLITGISASLSMAASEYLSTKEENDKNPIKAAIYTGIAYIITVLLLVMPFFMFSNIYVSLAGTIVVVLLAVALFNYYVSVAKGTKFFRRFLNMALVSIGVAIISFIIGVFVKVFIGIEV